ncbi:MAG: type II toxin-antitoxin system RelE/ParE family toxin [Candidatus Riflebacteria bacterium]|nr:type II toxin-antitoxin system RelE/ParE family toxin [Candidatus Riflebacteria bacterium]
MNYSFHPEAEAEFVEAINYFEEVKIDLGYEFAVEIYSAIEMATAFPKAWPIIEDNIRRCLVNRFSYGVLYSEEKEEIYIVAIMHLRREPDYWKHRK